MKIYTDELKNGVSLTAGQKVLLSGTVYTARDAAHKRILELLDVQKDKNNINFNLPFPVSGAVIYYAGPTETPPGLVCGSFGPTTSSRMDIFAPKLLDLGLYAMIGKGERNIEVENSIRRNNAIYFCALGGAGALAASHITSLEVIAFPELGCESVKKLTFKDFPLIAAICADGTNIFRRK